MVAEIGRESRVSEFANDLATTNAVETAMQITVNAVTQESYRPVAERHLSTTDMIASWREISRPVSHHIRNAAVGSCVTVG